MEPVAVPQLSHHDFSLDAKIWMFTSDKPFDADQELAIQSDMDDFCAHWESHGMKLKAMGFILYSRIIVLVVDESFHSISGCSVDNSVAFLKNLENKYRISLFDRLMQTAYLEGNWKTLPTAAWSKLYKENRISHETVFIDTLVGNLNDLMMHVEKKLGDFWLKRII
jgi:hypothetical protein